MELSSVQEINFCRHSLSAAEAGDEGDNHVGGINTQYLGAVRFSSLGQRMWKGIGVYGNGIFAVFRIANVCYNWKSVPKLVELAHSVCVMSECCLLGLVGRALC